jgi:sensor histidine kinase YesM
MKRPRVVAAHIIAWSVYILFYATLWREPGDNLGEAFVKQLWLLPPKLFLVYITVLVLIPRLFLRRRYVVFFIAIAAASLLGGLVNQVMVHFVIPAGVGVIHPHEAFWDISRMSKRLTYINSTLFFALTAEGIRMWYEQKEANARLVKEKIAAELSLLRSQLQPHFFFNTLNNLYSLTLQKSDLAPNLILQMSDMMRYIINSSQADRVMLVDEVNFIRGYIGIEAVRYSGKVKIETTWPDQMEEIRIPPLTLFPFVENAFKHGVAEELSSAWIVIVLAVDETGNLSFMVKNSFPGISQAKGAGIGLRNTKERLSILYGNDMTFSTQKFDGVFEARLNIKTQKV